MNLFINLCFWTAAKMQIIMHSNNKIQLHIIISILVSNNSLGGPISSETVKSNRKKIK